MSETAASFESMSGAINILRTLAEHYPDQSLIHVPFAEARKEQADLLLKTAPADEPAAPQLEQARRLLEETIADFDKYRSRGETDSIVHRRVTTSSAQSLAETLTRLNQK